MAPVRKNKSSFPKISKSLGRKGKNKKKNRKGKKFKPTNLNRSGKIILKPVLTKANKLKKVEEKIAKISRDEDEVESENESENKNEEKLIKKPKQETESKKHLSKDVDEGKTLFIRNIPYETTQDEFRELFRRFGEIHYALLCIDKVTDHPRGTGFVKFKEKEFAEACLQVAKNYKDGDGLVIHEQPLLAVVALSRDEISKKNEEKSDQKNKDSRNLSLLKEGFIKFGTPEAEGVSSQDLAVREQRKAWKIRKLKLLHFFLSRTRLCVWNLPFTIEDKNLKNLFLKHAGPGAVITEARIMRDMKQVEKGKGKSKGHGWINFTTHEHALKALHSINNNPKIFTNERRPIVEFSVENLNAHNVFKKRLVQNQKRKEEQLKRPREEKELTDRGNQNVQKIKRRRQEKFKQRQGKRQAVMVEKHNNANKINNRKKN